MQDAPSAMDFSVKADIRTVHTFLGERGGLGVLEDPDAGQAIEVVSNASGYGQPQPSRAVLEKKAAAKQEAIARICRRHVSEELSAAEIEQALASLADFNSFIESNRRPVDDMLTLLKTFFDPSAPEANLYHRLSINGRVHTSRRVNMFVCVCVC